MALRHIYRCHPLDIDTFVSHQKGKNREAKGKKRRPKNQSTMNIIPQKRSAEDSESVKRPKNTKSPSDSSPDKSDVSDPIEKCFGEGVQQSGSDEDESDFYSEDEVQVFACPDPNNPAPEIPVYCYRCKQADVHYTAFCHLPPEYIPVVEETSDDYCYECEMADRSNHYYAYNTYKCPHKIICDG